NLLTESFKLRVIADVPVGIFLSGGIDSSTVCALLSKEGINLRTFTIGFYEKDYNEASYAKQIAEYLGTEHTEMYCTPKEALSIIPMLPQLYDEPFGDSSAIPTFLVSQLAKSEVKVALSADGGDEQFCGYTRYLIIKNLAAKLSNFPAINLLSFLLDLISPEFANKLYEIFKFALPKYTSFKDKFVKFRNVLKGRDLLTQYDLALRYFLDEELTELISPCSQTPSLASKLPVGLTNYLDDFSLMMLIDLKTYLPEDLLTKVDRATMGTSLEGRDPFLDHKILEWTSQLPSEYKYKDGKSKHLIRKILYRYIPRNLLERPKQGFGAPIDEWFKKDLKDFYIEYLNEKKVKKEGLFNPKIVDTLLQNYLGGISTAYNKLWLLFVFEMWRERWRV
ncbi:MAG: asparagine synthetase B family protein, partial [bacterium]